jgi:hypothetical protein
MRSLHEASQNTSGIFLEEVLIVRPLDVPILKLNGRPLPQELDDRDEVVAFAPPDNQADEALQWPGQDPDRGTGRVCGLTHDGEPRGEQAVDPAEIADQALLVGNLQHAGQAVPPQGLNSPVGVATEESVAWEERDDRPDFPPPGGVGLPDRLRQVEAEPPVEQVPRRRLFLPGLRVQAPPAIVGAAHAGVVIPKRRRILVRLGGQDRHRAISVPESGGLAGRGQIPSALIVKDSLRCSEGPHVHAQPQNDFEIRGGVLERELRRRWTQAFLIARRR